MTSPAQSRPGLAQPSLSKHIDNALDSCYNEKTDSYARDGLHIQLEGMGESFLPRSQPWEGSEKVVPPWGGGRGGQLGAWEDQVPARELGTRGGGHETVPRPPGLNRFPLYGSPAWILEEACLVSFPRMETSLL